MARKLAELVVQMTADSAQLRADMAKVQRSTKNMERSFQRTGQVVRRAFAGLAVAAGFTGITRGIGQVVSSLDSLAKTADRVGLTTDALQELHFAATQTSVSTKTLDKSMERFARRFGEAIQGSGELVKILDQYGIAARDAGGNTRALDAVLNDVADAIQGAESQQERLRIAYQAFGREGLAMVEMLKQGSAGLDKFRARARELGLVVDREAIDAAVKFGDEMDVLKRTLGTAAAQGLTPLMPLMTQLTQGFQEAAQAGGGLHRVIGNISLGLQALAHATFGPMDAVIRLEDELDALDDRIKKLSKFGPSAVDLSGLAATGVISPEQFSDAIKGDVDALLDAWTAARAELVARIDAKRKEQFDQIMGVGADGGAPSAPPISDVVDTKALDQLTQMEQKLREQVATFEQADTAVLQYRLTQGDLAAVVQEAGTQGEALAGVLVKLSGEYEQLKTTAEAAAAELAIDEALREQVQGIADSLESQEDAIRTAYARRMTVVEMALERELVTHERSVELVNQLYEQQQKEIADLAERNKENIDERLQELTRAVQDFGRMTTDALVNAAMGGSASFADMADAIIADIARIIIKLQVIDPLVKAITGSMEGGSLGGLVGKIFGGARASGGPVSAGRAYLVGERGPELMVPGVSGNVVPLGGGGGGTVVQVIDQRSSGPQPEVQKTTGPDGNEVIRVLVRDAVSDAINSGKMDRTLASNFGLRRRSGG